MTLDKDALNALPVGTIIRVKTETENHLWYVFTPTKASVLDEHFPHSETEDLDWFAPETVTVCVTP